jgi:3-methyladenine DNA glycosylase Mpg
VIVAYPPLLVSSAASRYASRERHGQLTDSTLFLIAGIQYWYVMYLGYNALPFVARSELLISPILPIIVG